MLAWSDEMVVAQGQARHRLVVLSTPEGCSRKVREGSRLMGFAKIIVGFCSKCGCTMDKLNAGAPMKCGSLDDTLFLVITCAQCQADDVVNIWVDEYHGDGGR